MPILTVCPDNASIFDRKTGRILNSDPAGVGFRQKKKNVAEMNIYDLSWSNLTEFEARQIQDLFYSVGYSGSFDANFSSGGLPSGNYFFMPGLQTTSTSANQYQIRATIKEVRGT